MVNFSKSFPRYYKQAKHNCGWKALVPVTLYGFGFHHRRLPCLALLPCP
jgi:hypothetical protein